MRPIRAAALGTAAILLHACATSEPAPPFEPEPAAPLPSPPPGPPETVTPPDVSAPTGPIRVRPPVDYMRPDDLPGWEAEDHAAALYAYQAGCGVSSDVAAARTCAAARSLGAADAQTARYFLEDAFRVEPVPGQGVLTAYFAPEYPARTQPGGEFLAPVMPRPADFREGRPYAGRTEIEARAPNGALAWMKAEDLFFLQVQGSGVLTFEDGRRIKAVFDSHNSLPFTGIANPMRDRGLLAPDNISADSIRRWLADNRGPAADEIMRINQRYVFFRLEPDDGRDPAGAAGVPLPAGHAIAVDPNFHSYGDLYWIDANAPILAGAFPAYRRLAMALDTGGAITGQVRADLYIGKGDAAGTEAGRVRHDLRMYRLVPLQW